MKGEEQKNFKNSYPRSVTDNGFWKGEKEYGNKVRKSFLGDATKQ